MIEPDNYIALIKDVTTGDLIQCTGQIQLKMKGKADIQLPFHFLFDIIHDYFKDNYPMETAAANILSAS